MIGEPDPDQAVLLAAARKFGAEVLTQELARHVDDAHCFPDDVYAQMAGLGWLGIPFPEEYGGGGDLPTMLLASLSTSMFAAGNIYFRNVVNGGLNVLSSGTEDQKRLILPDLIAGRIKMCHAMTEPEAGSEVSNMRTYASRVGDEYRVSRRSSRRWRQPGRRSPAGCAWSTGCAPSRRSASPRATLPPSCPGTRCGQTRGWRACARRSPAPASASPSCETTRSTRTRSW